MKHNFDKWCVDWTGLVVHTETREYFDTIGQAHAAAQFRLDTNNMPYDFDAHEYWNDKRPDLIYCRVFKVESREDFIARKQAEIYQLQAEIDEAKAE